MMETATDTDIAARLEEVSALVRAAAERAGDDHARVGMLNSLAVLLRQPLHAAHVLVEHDESTIR